MIESWHLSNINWLNELPQAEAETLRQSANVVDFAAGELIFSPAPDPEHVFILETGLVRIYRESNNAAEVTFGYVQSGEVFGELAAFDERPRESFAIAVEPSRVLKINAQVFSHAIQAKSSIVFSVTKQVEGRFKQIESRVEDLVFLNARSRLARILLELANRFGVANNQGQAIQLNLTHAELATLIGASRPTVSITLGEFEDEKIISRESGKIIIIDKNSLQQAAAM